MYTDLTSSVSLACSIRCWGLGMSGSRSTPLLCLLLFTCLLSCSSPAKLPPNAREKEGKKEEMPVASGNPSSSKSILFGPGLNPRVATPARYIFVQAVDEAGLNFTSSPGPGMFTAFVGATGGQARDRMRKIKTEVFDQGDGTYQVLFIMNEQPERLTIEIRGPDRQLVGGKQLIFDWPETEHCNCPTGDGENFAENYGCPATEVQLEKDMEKFPVITEEMMKQAFNALIDKGSCFVHYVIRKGRIYAKAYGPYQGFKQYIDDILVSLARRVKLPMAEFVFNLGDWPQANTSAIGLPVMSWCGSNDTDDIIVPTYKSVLSTVFGKDMENVRDVDAKCFKRGDWKDKTPKLFWRGRDSNPVRTYFVDEVAARNLKHVDANISKNHFNYYPSEEDRRKDQRLQAGKKVERIGFLDYWRYKYLLNLDGTVAAYRLPALLAGNSVVLKQDSKWYEHFYAELEPFVHYIPVTEDATDVMDKLQWARTYDRRAQRIARRGREYARARLGAEAIYCYYFRALERYGGAMNYKPKVPPYDEVPQPAPACKCSDKPRKGRKKGRRRSESGVDDGGAPEAGGSTVTAPTPPPQGQGDGYGSSVQGEQEPKDQAERGGGDSGWASWLPVVQTKFGPGGSGRGDSAEL